MQKRRSFSAKDIAVIGLMMALSVVLTRFLSIETQFVRIGFSYIPMVLLAIMYGPWLAGTSGALADVVGFFLFARGFPFSPGFTLSAAVGPIIYGLILYRRQLTFWRIFLACLTVNLVVNVVLNSFWLWLLYDQAFLALLPVRIVQNVVSLPIDAGILYWLTGSKPIQRVMADYPVKWVH